MQKFMLFLVVCLGVPLTTCAQKTPPTGVVAAFNQKFHNVQDLEWERENGEWEAEFEQGGMEISASFSATGQWLETETQINLTDLPGPVQAALKGKKVKEAARILRADGSTVYEAEVKRKDLLYDASGKLLSKEKD